MKKTLIIRSLVALATLSVSAQASALGASTTTYVRCWYKTSTSGANTEAASVWAQDAAGTADYKLAGNWYRDGVTALANMFYTTTSQATLTKLCKDTLTRKKITQPLMKISAANTRASLNYAIWTQDAAQQPAKISKVVVFGDSVSDDGNLFNATNWLAPNRVGWFLGHFSNGKVWDEYLSDNLGLPSYNWAVGGAAGDRYLVVPGVTSQVSSYLDYMKEAANYNPGNTLFTMLMGANDIISYGRSAETAITAEQTALDNLIASGARNILVVNLPDLTKAPEFTYFRTDQVAMKAQIDDFNARQLAMVDALRTKWGSTLNLRHLDVNAKVGDMLRFPAKYNMTNITDSCLDLQKSATTNYGTSQSARSKANKFGKVCDGANVNGFVFWDLLHPSTTSHKVIGDYATEEVRKSFPSL